MEINDSSKILKPTVVSILKNVESGIGLDVAKNHTGITIWNGESIETYGFELEPYDTESPFAEYKMRRDFKNKLKEVVNGRHFEYAIIEDVYGGENFDTTRKLLALNTVIDELIFERVCTVGKFVRWNEPKWLKACRTLYKQRGRLKSKLEVQGILEFLEWNFYLEHKDDKPAKKKEIFFEDICDSCGMLLGLVAQEIIETNMIKSSSLKMSDIKMVYIENIEDCMGIKDTRIRDEGFIAVDLDFRHIETSILNLASQHPLDVMCAFLPSSKLGLFGTKHKLVFYDNDEGYLLFYKK